MKVGDTVKIGKCIDDSNPIPKCYRNRIGKIQEIINRHAPTTVVIFADKSTEAFWPEELMKVR